MNTGTYGQCGTCGERLTPRGGLPPRFCPRCGRRLARSSSRAGPSHHAVGSTRVCGPAVASLVIGILAMITPCGVPAGLLAIFLGIVGRMKIEESRGHLTGGGLATAGIVLGVIASGIWGAVCAASL